MTLTWWTSVGQQSLHTLITNQNLSSHYYDLLSFPNSSFFQFSFDDYVAFWYQVLMNAINESCHRKTNRRLEFPYFYSSYSIHMINKLRTAAKNNYEPTYQKKLKDDIQNSIELDKTILIDSLSPNSTRSCFKYLRSFSLNHLPNQMHWKHITKLAPIFILLTSSIPTSALYTKQATQHFYQKLIIHLCFCRI